LPKPAGPIDFTAERARHERFVGRTTLLTRLDQFLIEDQADRWVVVTGGPGMGKSALLAAWLARRETAGAVVPHHFIRRGEYDWNDPAKLVGSLVAQIVARFPDQPEPEVEAPMHPAARLDTTLRRVSKHALVPRRERLVILIDGLDEYDLPSGPPVSDPLAAFLPHTLPRGVSLLCASRPRHPYVDMLVSRGAVQFDLDDEPSFGADNKATVRAFWELAAPELGLDARFLDQAVDRAGGNLQHAAMLRKHVEGLPPAQRRVEDIPRGLAALLASAWERIATDPVVVDGLGILCAAREALTLDELGAVAGWTGEPQRRAFVRGARELLIETQRADAVPEYRLHHDSIRTQIARALGAAVLRAHHHALAQKLATWPAPRDVTVRRYALRHALLHRAEAGEWADAWRLASDMTFLEAKCRELGAQDVDADVARTAERCGSSGDEMLRRRFVELARALGRESHWLRATREATAALVWNRLRQSGWSPDDLDQQLQLPANASFLRVRHVATRESPSLERNFVGHASRVTACAVTPDGRRVISASEDQTLKVCDLETGVLLATLKGHAKSVTACAVTPDGRRVVSASTDRTLKVWDLGTGALLATLQGHAESVTACAVTPDGRRVVSASYDHTLKVWDLGTGSLLATPQGHAKSVTACAVTPDGRRIVSASYDHTIKVWDLETGALLTTLQGHGFRVTGCPVTPDGQRVVSASYDHTIKVWDLETGALITTLQGHAHGVTACAVTPDSRRVVSASYDRTLKVWDLGTGALLATLQGHAHGVTACAMTPDGRRVVSASMDSTIKVWNLGTRARVATLEGHASSVTACAVTPDGRRVVSASMDNTLKVWDLGTGTLLASLEGHATKVTACAVTPDGRRVISASTNTLKVWDLRTGALLTTLASYPASVTACAVTPDGRRVVSAWNDHELKVWDLETGASPARLEGHIEWVTACAVAPDGQRVVSASADATLRVWDLKTMTRLVTLKGHTASVTACAVTPDSHRVVSASTDNTLKVWNLRTGALLATLRGHADRVIACVVTPDGRRVVSASTDNTLKIWNLRTGTLLATLKGHADRVIACAVTPDGRRVVSASTDNTLKVWDLASGACLLTHYANATYMAFIATVTVLVAGDETGAVWFLDLPPSNALPSNALPSNTLPSQPQQKRRASRRG